MTALSRRALLKGAVGAGGLVALGAVAGCSEGAAVLPTSPAVSSAEAARRRTGARVVTGRLTAGPVTVDLGGPVLSTWAYGDAVPGPTLRARAGDVLRVRLDNRLPASTSVHWHGVALRNDMDGVPGLTQRPVGAGTTFDYEFTVPDPGTYFFHPHSGAQLDRGLYGVLVVEDPAEPGGHDAEWVVVLDDWVDGTGRTPDRVLADLRAADGGDMHGMAHMGGRGRSAWSPLLGGAGDVDHPFHLLNGRVPTAPRTFTGRPGQRVRVRLVNAGADTAYRVALGGHRLTVTHTDGFPVRPEDTDSLLVGMGERYDVLVTLGDGAFPLVAVAEGKGGRAAAVVRTSAAARAPDLAASPRELAGRVLLGTDLAAAEAVRLPRRPVDRWHDLVLSGSMAPYRWTVNGRPHPDSPPLPVREGERVRLRFANHSMMFHPMHVHGHTFAVAGTGTRKDTVVVGPMRTVVVDLDADNPGQWAAHCHNIYHAEAGMMTTLSYRA